MSDKKYPYDVFTAQTNKQTFSVKSCLAQAKSVNDQSPLKIYDQRFARYELTIIDYKSNDQKKFVVSNIRVREMEDLVQRTRYAFRAEMDEQYAPKPVAEGNGGSAEMSGPAFTVKIRNGRLAGKTPAEVLFENPNGASDLRSQVEFLKSHLDKYPGNRVQIEAIEQALSLQAGGAFAASGQAQVVNRQIRLYPAAPVTPPKALTHKPCEGGMYPAHECEIYWHVGDMRPVEVRIKNYRVPVDKKGDGRIVPDRSKAVFDVPPKSMRLSEAEWMECLRAIRTDMRNFEMLCAMSSRADADDTDRAERSRAAASSGKTVPIRNTAYGGAGNANGTYGGNSYGDR